MSDFLFEALRERLKRLKKEREEAISLVNERVLKDRDVILKTGKYKNRRAKIIEYFYNDNGSESLHVLIYRIDDKVGFKGREQFIDSHYNEFIYLKDCEIL